MILMRTRAGHDHAWWIAALVLVGCSGGPTDSSATGERSRTLTLASSTVLREVYGEAVLPAFAEHWSASRGDHLHFQESYDASGAQTNAIVNGFEADVASLSFEGELAKLSEAGLIQRGTSNVQILARTIVALGVRKGNPKDIRGWDDLERTDLSVSMPDPRISGGGVWAITALYGAAMRGHTTAAKNSPAEVELLMAGVLRRVRRMYRASRDLMREFDRGDGDVIVTYESEILLRIKDGEELEVVVPPSTILVEFPVVAIETYARRHGNLDLTDELMRFLATTETRALVAEYGLHPADADMRQAASAEVEDLFTVQDLGGWSIVETNLLSEQGIFAQAMDRVGR